MLKFGLFLLVATCMTTSVLAQSSPLVEHAFFTLQSLERQTGMPIAVLERNDNDPAQFWYSAVKTLCKKTNDNWCEQDVTFLQDTTNQIGWARKIDYVNTQGVKKTVCAILPPNPGLYPGFIATALGGGAIFNREQFPTPEESEAFVIMMHAGNCLNKDGSEFELKRADAFAAMSLALIQGHPAFTTGLSMTPARKFSQFRFSESTRWSVNVAERLILEIWKPEAASALQAVGCSSISVPSTNLAVDTIGRLPLLPAGQDCTTDINGQTQISGSGEVNDSNLWIWMYGAAYGGNTPRVGAPPKPWTPFKPFPNYDAGVLYAWQTAASIAQQR